MVQIQLMLCWQGTGITGSLTGLLLGLRDGGPMCMMCVPPPSLGTPHGEAGWRGGSVVDADEDFPPLHLWSPQF